LDSIISRKQVVAFAGTFTHTGEYRHTVVGFGDVVDQFHDQYGFAYTGAPEQTDFTTFCVRFDQVDNLDTGVL
jgi:hypothetical protein